MSTPPVIASFYDDLWNAGDASKLDAILAPGFAFRGSLGQEAVGVSAFCDYVCLVRGALAEYRCEILECVTEGQQAFAKMRFVGRHVGPFLGYAPTNRMVTWDGAALFRIETGRIAALWVLGDVEGLRRNLDANATRHEHAEQAEGRPMSTIGHSEWRCEHSVETSADPEVIWQLLQDVPSWPNWNAGIERIDLAGPFRTGTEFRMTLPGGHALISRLFRVTDGESFEDETCVGEVTVRVLHRIEVTGVGRCRITFSLVAVGPGCAEVGTAASADFPDVLNALAGLAGSRSGTPGRRR
jgi:predicted ester cyclase